MSFLDRIRHCNNAEMGNYVPLSISGGQRVGWVRRDRVRKLLSYRDVFTRDGGDGLVLLDGISSVPGRTARLSTVLEALRDAGEIGGWRDELYAASPAFGREVLFHLERAACPYLGIRAWGFHLDGYVRKRDGIHLWIAKRSATKQTYPGMLDNMVAGGHPAGLSLAENLIKECAEEAGIPADLAAKAIPVGAVSYLHELDEGLKPDEMFIYELELPEDFQPVPADGEVESFTLMPAKEVMDIVRSTDRFKFNCNLSLISFFLRHGLIDPDSERDYTAICEGL